jgi:hypothetical protein
VIYRPGDVVNFRAFLLRQLFQLVPVSPHVRSADEELFHNIHPDAPTTIWSPTRTDPKIKDGYVTATGERYLPPSN